MRDSCERYVSFKLGVLLWSNYQKSKIRFTRRNSFDYEKFSSMDEYDLMIIDKCKEL